MNRNLALAAAMLLLALTTNCLANTGAQNNPSATAEPTLPRAMKGYELYSWQNDGEWYFSLLEGTNRIKTFEEITADSATAKGIDSIERKLGRLSRGEQVFWTLRGIPNLALPPEGTVDQIKGFCARSGIELVVTE